MAITLRALRYYLAAIECGSIAGAAQAMSVAPSAIGAAIDGIEAALNLTLVHRRRARGLEPTPEGVAFARRAGLLVEEYEGLISFGAELQDGFTGALRIGYYAPVAPAFLPAIVAPLLSAHPGLSVHFVECDTDTARSGLSSGHYDAILFLAGEAQAGIDIVPLVEASPYLLMPPGDPLGQGQGRAVALSALADKPFVMLDLPVVRGYYRALFDAAGIEPRIVATGTTHEMVRSLVGAGVGYAVLNMMPLTDRTYGGNAVRAVPLTPMPDMRPLTLAVGTVEARRRRVVEAFVRACTAYFSDEQARAMVVGGPRLS